MGKCIAYTAGAITCMGIGALVTGVALYFAYPGIRGGTVTVEAAYAQCDLQPASGYTASGRLYFSQATSVSGTRIKGSVTGLTAGLHGFHIHEYGSAASACNTTGAHYNPDNQPHGGPDSESRHVGDLGNLNSVGDSGVTVAIVDIVDTYVSLSGDLSVMGRAVVIHSGQDDLGASGDSAGASGARVACCNIYEAPAPSQ